MLIALLNTRPTSAKVSVPIVERREELKCGIAAVDLRSGRLIEVLDFQTVVEENFDVQLLLGIRFSNVNRSCIR